MVELTVMVVPDVFFKYPTFTVDTEIVRVDPVILPAKINPLTVVALRVPILAVPEILEEAAINPPSVLNA
jgi:hypothetical protein